MVFLVVELTPSTNALFTFLASVVVFIFAKFLQIPCVTLSLPPVSFFYTTPDTIYHFQLYMKLFEINLHQPHHHSHTRIDTNYHTYTVDYVPPQICTSHNITNIVTNMISTSPGSLQHDRNPSISPCTTPLAQNHPHRR